MNRILKTFRSLDWRVLFAVPMLSILLGMVNNLRVDENRRVRWFGERPTIAVEAEAGVERGVWTTDFVSVTNAAETAHLPVVVVALLPGCPSCVRLHNAIQSGEVKAWQKRLGWYFVLGTYSEAPELLSFVKTTPVSMRGKLPPYVGVYWKRADGRYVMRSFSGRSNLMGVPEEPSLGLEWMHAVEAAAHSLGVQISVRAESEKLGSGRVKSGLGRVEMSPQVDVIQPGQSVVLTAVPRNGAVFAGWRYPDGRIVDGGLQLTLDDQCQAGDYRAIFRRSNGKDKGGVLKTDGEEK